MISSITGKIEEINNQNLVVISNNIGYNIYILEKDIQFFEENISKEQKIYTYLNVKEDELKLYGFVKKEELEFFKKIILVSGVGPKMAMGIISNVSVYEMGVAIATGNVESLKKVPKVGPKLAQRIILELKDKIQSVNETMYKLNDKNSKGSNENLSKNLKQKEEAIKALEVLGFNRFKIDETIKKLDILDMSVEEIIKEVLKTIQK